MKTDHILIIAVILATLLSGCSHIQSSGSAWRQVGTASWYGEDFHGKPTASGEIYNMYGCSAAHKTLPLGTRVRVTNLDNGRRIVVPINDRGPFVGNRIIDMSYGAARRLGMVKEGLAKVCIEVIQPPDIKGINVSRYTLQLGAYTQRQNAVAMADRLTNIGYTPNVEDVYVHGKLFHRVRLGTFPSYKKAEEFAGRLNDNGFEYTIIGL